MPFDCPKAPFVGSPLALKTTVLPAGKTLVRFHGSAYPANSFNPNTGADWLKPLDGARFNPFPDLTSTNVPTIYAADSFTAAALESVFHAVEHVPSPRYLRSQLATWRYSELELKRDLEVFELTNPNLRQLVVRGRPMSLVEAELIHSQNDQYPNTRTWARLLYLQVTTLHGLGWRPRLGGEGTSYVLFGSRCHSTDLGILSGPTSIESGHGFDRILEVAVRASIRIVNS
jgi:hypothetical protein